jgi:hypothetical protein
VAVPAMGPVAGAVRVVAADLAIIPAGVVAVGRTGAVAVDGVTTAAMVGAVMAAMLVAVGAMIAGAVGATSASRRLTAIIDLPTPPGPLGGVLIARVDRNVSGPPAAAFFMPGSFALGQQCPRNKRRRNSYTVGAWPVQATPECLRLIITQPLRAPVWLRCRLR